MSVKEMFRKFLLLLNYNHQRREIDIEILWPLCKQYAPDLATARLRFALHAINDPAWKSLGKAEIQRRIQSLT